MKKVIVILLLVISYLLLVNRSVVAQQKLEINFFYSVTCPHCQREQIFLDKIEKQYPDIKINRFEISKNRSLLSSFYKKYSVSFTSQWRVPITFIKDRYFVGFSDPVSQQIEELLSGKTNAVKQKTDIISRIDPKKYSLPILAVVLGVLDGFNVCSLGALLIILSLVLSLRSRKKIIVFGSSYIITTALVYGVLIFFWYQLFNIITPYIRKMEIVIGLITAIGAGYFFKEFLKSYRYGPNCEIDEGKKITGKFSIRFQKMVQEAEKLLPMVLTILIFAATITIVEFPCSAAIPLVFAGILSKAHLSVFLYLFYMFIYLIFYLLDEIVTFLIAVFTMKLWLSSPKFVTWIIFTQAVIMFFLSIHYLFGLI